MIACRGSQQKAMCCVGVGAQKLTEVVARGRAKKTGRAVKYERRGFFALGISA